MSDEIIRTRFGAFHTGEPVDFDIVGHGRLEGIVTPVGIRGAGQTARRFEEEGLPTVVPWYQVRFAKKKEQQW